MASKILKKFLGLFIFTGMMSSISSKNHIYQQTLTNSGFQSSEHQVLFQKIRFYAATVQYQHVVIPIPLWETIQELIKIFANLGTQQQQMSKSKDPYAKFKATLRESARERIAKVINNINDIIESLPEDQRLTKWMIGDIHSKHLQNLNLSVDKIRDIISALLKNNPAQLITEIDQTLEMGHKVQNRITNLVENGI